MHSTSPDAAGLTGRTIVASDSHVALAQLVDGEKEAVDAHCDSTYYSDPDDRPVPFQVNRFGVAVLDAGTGDLLGTMNWHPVPFLAALSGTAWNLGIRLLPKARGRRLSRSAGLLLARHLFDTTDVDRLQALTDVANVPGWLGLERAGFHREGVIRGGTVRSGKRRDMLLYSLLRTDLEDGERTVLARRDGVVLATSLPGDQAEVPGVDVNLLSPVGRATLRAAVLDNGTGRLLGTVNWQPVDYGGAHGCAAWSIGVALITHDVRVAAMAQRLLAQHLFISADLDRVQTGVEAGDLVGQVALERLGFHRDGTVRGARLRDGQRQDLILYGIIRTDIG